MNTTKRRTTKKGKKNNRKTPLTVVDFNNVYTKNDYNSNDGMLTSVWGPGMWHYLHTTSFNYPVNPTKKDKEHYYKFMLQLKYVLPCGKCRKNLRNNYKKLPLTMKHLKNRDMFSKYVFDLHELINTMLGKKSGLTYETVRERYEHFRARCSIGKQNKTKKRDHSSKKNRVFNEKGCTESLYGEKSKCILQIVPQDTKCETLRIDTQCIKSKLNVNEAIGKQS
tara:strand:+ start:5422 stop:6090 length:669 start_codon:yes stop_codon:yes gene_type:complete